MDDAVKAWAGMTTPPPRAADHTVETLVQTYLASGGEVHTFGWLQTTPEAKIKFKFRHRPEWAGGTGIPPEMRRTKKLFRARPQIGSKLWRTRHDTVTIAVPNEIRAYLEIRAERHGLSLEMLLATGRGALPPGGGSSRSTTMTQASARSPRRPAVVATKFSLAVPFLAAQEDLTAAR